MINKIIMAFGIIYMSLFINYLGYSVILNNYGCKEKILDLRVNLFIFGSKLGEVNKAKYHSLTSGEIFGIALIPNLVNLAIAGGAMSVKFIYYSEILASSRYVINMIIIVNVMIFIRKILLDIAMEDNSFEGSIAKIPFATFPLFILSILNIFYLINILLVAPGDLLILYASTIIFLGIGFISERLIRKFFYKNVT